MTLPQPPQLTRALLLRIIELNVLFHGGDDLTDDVLMEWTELYNENATEILALALAALDRLTPYKRGPYKEREVSKGQRRVMEFIGEHPGGTAREMIETLGVDHTNLRRMLQMLCAREHIVKDGRGWRLAGATASIPVVPEEEEEVAVAPLFIGPLRKHPCEIETGEDGQQCGNASEFQLGNRSAVGRVNICSTCIAELQKLKLLESTYGRLYKIEEEHASRAD